jgi:hypothetical protein
MPRWNRRGGLIASALWIVAGLLTPALLQTSCKVTIPDMSINVDDNSIQVEAPGLSVYIKPGHFDGDGSHDRSDWD